MMQSGKIGVRHIGRSTIQGPVADLPPAALPNAGWDKALEKAEAAVAAEARGEVVIGGQRFRTVKLEDAVDAIRALKKARA